MNAGEIIGLLSGGVLLITAVGGVIINMINIHINKVEIDKLSHALEEALLRRKEDQQSIIWIGEGLSRARADNGSLVLLVNQLFREYEQATGKKPEIDLEMFAHFMTIKYITGKLGPLEVK